MLVSTPYFLGISMSCRQTLNAAGEDRAEDGVGALERLAAVHGGDDLGRVVALARRCAATARRAKSSRSSSMSISARVGAFQRGKGEDVPDERPGEPEAACADERDFRHRQSFPSAHEIAERPAT